MVQSLHALLRVLILSIKCLPYIYFPSFDVISCVLVIKEIMISRANLHVYAIEDMQTSHLLKFKNLVCRNKERNYSDQNFGYVYIQKDICLQYIHLNYDMMIN